MDFISTHPHAENTDDRINEDKLAGKLHVDTLVVPFSQNYINQNYTKIVVMEKSNLNTPQIELRRKVKICNAGEQHAITN